MSSASSHKCNGLEAFFVDTDIRFGAAMLFSSSFPLSKMKESLKTARAKIGVKGLRVSENIKPLSFVLCEDESADEDVLLKTFPAPIEMKLRGTAIAHEERGTLPSKRAKFMSSSDEEEKVKGQIPKQDLLSQLSDAFEEEFCVTRSAFTITTTLLCSPSSTPKKEESVEVIGIIINANHALMDGRAMRAYLPILISCLNSKNNVGNSDYSDILLPRPRALPSDWGECLDFTTTDGSFDQFLPLPSDYPTVNLADIFVKQRVSDGTDNEKRLHTYRSYLDGQTFNKTKKFAKVIGGTVTGLLIACFQQAIAEIYFGQTPATTGAETASSLKKCVITAQIIVDMRPYLVKDAYVVQAISSVMVGSIVSEQTSEEAIKKSIQERAVTLTEDIRRRIKRGEAHKQALCLTTSQFELGTQVLPSATFELSNHGEYSTSENETVLIGQRINAFDGFSVGTHSESASQVFRLAASGPVFSTDFVFSLLERVVELMKLMV